MSDNEDEDLEDWSQPAEPAVPSSGESARLWVTLLQLEDRPLLVLHPPPTHTGHTLQLEKASFIQSSNWNNVPSKCPKWT